jgi:hypothetical protein
MPTVSALALELASEAGESTTDTDYLSLVRGWIKDGYREIGDKAAWAFLKTDESVSFTVAGGDEYETQATCSEITYMRLTATDTPVIYVPVERLASLGLDLEQTGRPKYFYSSGYNSSTGKNKFKVWPVPDGTYAGEIHENGRPVELEDADTIPMPTNFLTIMKDYVRMMQAKDDKDYELYDRMDTKWQKALAERMLRYSKQPARHIRLRVSDITGDRAEMQPVRLPPEHFSN